MSENYYLKQVIVGNFMINHNNSITPTFYIEQFGFYHEECIKEELRLINEFTKRNKKFPILSDNNYMKTMLRIKSVSAISYTNIRMEKFIKSISKFFGCKTNELDFYENEKELSNYVIDYYLNEQI